MSVLSNYFLSCNACQVAYNQLLEGVSMASESFGQRLQRLRAEAGLTQERVATAAGVPVQTLRNWEHDRRQPLIGIALPLARALGVSVDTLVGDNATAAAKPAKRKKGGKG
jgi:transcriptional regulator with XRE-family HTH domain